RGLFNSAEIFYSIVPDPAATLSCAHSVSEIKNNLPVTFVHEFQHMISYNQHVLVRRGQAEILWLNEGLSHYAEERGGRSFLPLPAGDSTFCFFVSGDLYDAGQYLANPESHFLVDTSGIGGLAERGAYWLFVRYLVDHFGGTGALADADAFTRTLVQTGLTGAANGPRHTKAAHTDPVDPRAAGPSDRPGGGHPACRASRRCPGGRHGRRRRGHRRRRGRHLREPRGARHDPPPRRGRIVRVVPVGIDPLDWSPGAARQPVHVGSGRRGVRAQLHVRRLARRFDARVPHGTRGARGDRQIRAGDRRGR